MTALHQCGNRCTGWDMAAGHSTMAQNRGR